MSEKIFYLIIASDGQFVAQGSGNNTFLTFDLEYAKRWNGVRARRWNKKHGSIYKVIEEEEYLDSLCGNCCADV